mmetsp:Transcript_63381/g.100764  ORF Transcript_63381/g.100764 Transcript_63381/m.100764 type:complete len:206 (+) Transcript_63381:236-853(+)
MGASEIAVEPAIQRDTIWKKVAHTNCWRPCFGALLYKRGTRRKEGSAVTLQVWTASTTKVHAMNSMAVEFLPTWTVHKFIGTDGLMALPSGLASNSLRPRPGPPRLHGSRWRLPQQSRGPRSNSRTYRFPRSQDFWHHPLHSSSLRTWPSPSFGPGCHSRPRSFLPSHWVPRLDPCLGRYFRSVAHHCQDLSRGFAPWYHLKGQS